MKPKQKTITAVVMIVILAAAGVTFLATLQNQKTIKIGYIGPLTGNAAIVGIDAAKAIEIAVNDANERGGINGRQIELFIEDDQYETSKTLTAYNKLVQANKVDILIISTYGGLFAVAEQARQDNVLLLDPLDCDDDIAALPDNVFCIAKNTQDLGYIIADYAAEKGYTKAGVLHATIDKFMPSVNDFFKERFEQRGGNVQVESYIGGTQDFRTSLLKMKDSEVLVVLGYDEIGIAMKQARELDINAPFLTVPSVANSPGVQASAKGAAEGTLFAFYSPSPSNEKAMKFQEEFQNAAGRKPNFPIGSDQAYDSMQILVEKVLPKATATNSAERVKQMESAMLSVKDFPGVTGVLTMRPNGKISGIELSMFKLADGKPVKL